MYFKEDRLVLTVERRDFYEHQLNALLKYSLHDVLSNIVHHINHCKFDNRIENLQVMTKSEHSTHHTQREFHPNVKLEPHIRDAGTTAYGNKRYSLLYDGGKYFASSTDYSKLETILKAWDSHSLDELKKMWSILNSNDVPYPRIIKAGFKKGKQNYKILYNKKVIKQSVNYNSLVKYYQDTFHMTPI